MDEDARTEEYCRKKVKANLTCPFLEVRGKICQIKGNWDNVDRRYR